ncbi:probable LRR receptor-like serine/threonine-protein kinase At1g06840 [Actinidia eriantha]|uniref:probable LRR receptor-like serine/threonine-protein kinase At1g06840 n=1 Tax=Actinidia eriantha TaxID=165200 RepID=UPI002585169B|nr:probable LRR receptor-like serine/threonine-protein kinase At1g06840 [Actinidia eriantha]
MASTSRYLLLSFVSCYFALLAAGQMTHPSEVTALQAIRRKLKDPLRNLRNWKKNDPCVSHWIGVNCDFYPSDGFQHVKELRLLNKNLSGILAPELGQLSRMEILDFMWNNISGSIPKEIGNITSLQLLLLSGNQISGPLPDELGFLPNLTKFQLDLNYISGPLPKSFANLPSVKHFHMNNNSISGQIPPELSALPLLIHFLLDNNNLSGYLPPELSKMPSLKILQLDNNNFGMTEIPASYGNMSKLLKLSLRNCNLQGTVPDLSGIPGLLYLDLSQNQLTGSIPPSKLSVSITTIDLSNNTINGSIPSSFSGLPRLQNLSLQNNLLSGFIPSTIWKNMTFSKDAKLKLDFQNNLLSDISGSLDPPSNVTIMLQGNPVCARGNQLNISRFCGPGNEEEAPEIPSNSNNSCPPQACPVSNNFQYVPASPESCFCAAPLGIGLRLRSPSISDFPPYRGQFEGYITSNLRLELYQLSIDSFEWQKGPRLRMYLKIFPQYSNDSSTFNISEIQRITDIFAKFLIPSNDTFGPYDLLNFTLLGPYSSVFLPPLKTGLSKGAVAGIVLGAISCAITLILAITLVFMKKLSLPRYQPKVSKDQSISKIPVKMEGVKGFGFKELEMATSSFSITTQIGHGGYGNVYKGILTDGTVVAIKRAQQASLQGAEFYTEIELLSRLHHRNLVSLVGYCNEEGEQMLVYEFMPNGSLHDHLSAKFRETLSFGRRLNIALGAAKGILYLHTEADPAVIHRDIKANNILLDSKFTAKVSDFGISKLAPVTDAKGVETADMLTAVKGTPGYLDPEYLLTHRLTEKSDVYSIGIVFLELLTGMRPISHGRNIVHEVNAACQSGLMFSIIDRNMGPYPSECIKRFMALALKCSQDKTDVRPTMLEVVRELENLVSELPESDTVQLELNASSSGISESATSSVYVKRSPYVSMDFPGSDLVSGVIPTIRPR